MRLLVIVALSLTCFNIFAKPLKPISSACTEKVAYQIINFLEKEEPNAELHLLKVATNGELQIVGLTDVSKIYPTIDFVNTVASGNNRFTDNYQYDTVIVYADYQVNVKNGKVSCKILEIGTAQDDQDQE